MSYVARRLSFNAAFLREIKEDNRRLRELLCDAEDLLRRPARPKSLDRQREIVRMLLRLRDQLALHFALENAFGYLVHVVDHAPRLCTQAQRMIAEHDDLFLNLCEIIDHAESLVYEGAQLTACVQLSREFFQFSDRFNAHEAAENELLLDTFDADIGVGD